jgi:hypothetical protein
MTCGDWLGDAWSSNLLNSVSLVSSKIDIGPVHRTPQPMESHIHGLQRLGEDLVGE